jgi:NADPH:quinone reductase-like Zn-dependent oxidoreductase
MVKSLAADERVDYTKEHFTQSGETCDLVFDAVGRGSASLGQGSLKEKGLFLSVKSTTSPKAEDLASSGSSSRQARLEP